MRAAASALALVLGILPSHDARADATAPRVASYDLAALVSTPKSTGSRRAAPCAGAIRLALPADRLCFHLYLNAFRDERSSFLREADPAVADELAASGWGGIDLRHLRDESGRDLADRLVFAAPDDGNAADATLAWVDLARPVPPGGAAHPDDGTPPRVSPRWSTAPVTSASSSSPAAVPKIGRRLADGAWSCHQHHATSEFSADFGDYRVALDLPAGWEVGATGAATAPASEAAGRRKIAFAATGVHDFAWSASPGLEPRGDRAATRRGPGGAGEAPAPAGLATPRRSTRRHPGDRPRALRGALRVRRPTRRRWSSPHREGMRPPRWSIRPSSR